MDLEHQITQFQTNQQLRAYVRVLAGEALAILQQARKGPIDLNRLDGLYANLDTLQGLWERDDYLQTEELQKSLKRAQAKQWRSVFQK